MKPTFIEESMTNKSSSQESLRSMNPIFSCVGNENGAQIIHTDNVNDDKVADSYIAICNINIPDEKVVGHVYAYNLNTSFLLNNGSIIPMLRIVAAKHTDSSRENLAEISSWFIPKNKSDIILKKSSNSSHYDDINLEGTFSFMIKTWTLSSLQPKNTQWIFDIKHPATREQFIELMCTDNTFLSIVNAEWQISMDNIKKTVEYLFKPPKIFDNN
jgi:hypothetical protein